MSDEAERLAEKIRNNESLQNETSDKGRLEQLQNEHHGLQIAIQTEIANQTGDTLEPAEDKK